MARISFDFDQNKCTGCGACSLACTIENELPFTESWRQILTLNPERLPGLAHAHLSLACNHCEHPACLEACPAAAYRKDGATGAVLIDDAKCIGCRYCTWACPYDAPKFSHERGTVSKCTFCAPRLRDGLEPACAAYCPTDALNVRVLEESEMSNGVAGFPETDLGPAIRIVPLVPGAAAPVPDPATVAALPAPAAAPRKISFRSEWSLAVFTYLVAVLAGAMTAHRIEGFAVPWLPFAIVAALAMGLSAAHLGRKERAWRAVLNLRTSWLSREVVTVSGFVGLSVAHLAVWPENTALCGVAVGFGVLALFSIDRVYDVTVALPGSRPHSAGALLTGIFLAAVFAGVLWAAALLGATKGVLYARRKLAARAAGEAWRPAPSAVRVFAGLAIPVAAWWALGDAARVPVLALILFGEFLDRAEFYEELIVESPARRVREALRART